MLDFKLKLREAEGSTLLVCGYNREIYLSI